MARIRATKITKDDTGLVNSLTVALPTHVVGDCLLIFIGHDAADTDFSLPSGWTAGPTNVVGAGTGTGTVRGSSFYKVAASGSETNPTFTWTTVNEVIAQAISIEGAHSTPIDASTSTTDITGAPYTSATVNTNFNNSLVLTACISDGPTQPTAYPGPAITCAEDAGAVGLGVCWTLKAVAGTSTAVNFYCGGNADESVLLTVAIRDGSSGAIIPGYLQDGYANIVDPLRGTTAIASVTYPSDSIRFYDLGGTTKNNPTSVLQADVSVPSFVDYTTAATNATDADVLPFPSAEAVGDYIAIGHSSTFDTVIFDRAGCTNGAGGVATYQYWNGTSWATLAGVIDGTASTNGQAFRLAAADKQVLKFTKPTDWATTSLNGETADYKIRITVSTVYSTNPTISQIWVGDSKYFCSYDAFTSNADTGVNLYESTSSITPQGTSPALAGAMIAPSSTDLSAGLLLVTFQAGTPRDYLDLGEATHGGYLLGILDASNNTKAWSLSYYGDLDTDPDGRNIAVIQPSQSVNTAWVTGVSGNPTLSNITGVLFANASKYGAAIFRSSQLISVPGYCTISGGSSTTKLSWTDVVNAFNGYYFPLISKSTNTAKVPIKIGGNDSIHLDASLFSLQFPKVSADDASYTKAHVDPSVLGVFIDARSGDTCKLRLGSITGLSKIQFNILATASASAVYDFSGLSVVNADVTLRAVTTFSDMSFFNCTSFTQNGAVISGCVLDNSKITSNNPSNIQSNEFTSPGTGHGIEITTPGTYTFTGNTFTGYGADGTANAAIYNNSGGAVTLQLGSGDSTPTVRNGAGATTTIEPVVVGTTFNAPNIPDGSTIGIYNTTADTVIDYVASLATGVGYSKTLVPGVDYTVGDDVSFRAIKVSGVTATKEYTFDITTTAGGGTIPISTALEPCPVYNALAIDGSAITDYVADYTDTEVDIVVAANFYISELFAWWKYNLTTSSGMRRFWGGITAVDEGNFQINSSIVSIKLDNTTATQVWALDNRRLFRTDGVRPVRNPTSGGGGVDVEWREQVLITNVDDVLDLIKADEYHTATTIVKKLSGTSTVLLTKNHVGTPLSNLQVTQ